MEPIVSGIKPFSLRRGSDGKPRCTLMVLVEMPDESEPSWRFMTTQGLSGFDVVRMFFHESYGVGEQVCLLIIFF